MSKTSINHIGHAHNDWLRSLDFYKQELTVLRDRLTEIGGKNMAREVSLEVEQYENRFKVQQDNIDRLRHDIRENVHSLSTQAQENKAGYVERDLVERFMQLSEVFVAEEKAVNELRYEFNHFSAAWM
jgi:hypothetical protein